MNFKKYLPLAVGVLLLIISFHDFDYKRIKTILTGITYYIMVPALLFELANLYIRSQRLRVILDPIKRITKSSIFSYYSIGSFANVAFPALSGQVIRTLLFSRKYKITKTSFATGTILEILFDGLCLFGLMVGISFMAKLPEWMIRWEFWIGIVVVAIAISLIMIYLNSRSISNFGARFKSIFPGKLVLRFSTSYDSFIRALALLKSYRHITKVSSLTLLSWAINGVVVYLMFMAFGFTLEPWAAYFMVVVNSLAIMIVVTPGNVGTFNLACALGLSLFGIDKTEALSFSLLLYAVTFLPVIATGLVFTLKEGISILGIKDSAAAPPQ